MTDSESSTTEYRAQLVLGDFVGYPQSINKMLILR